MLCFGFLIVFSCSDAAPKAPPSNYCQIVQPVRPHPDDTHETKVQAAREFAKWKAICGAKK